MVDRKYVYEAEYSVKPKAVKKIRECLKCDKKFKSVSKENRLCVICAAAANRHSKQWGD